MLYLVGCLYYLYQWCTVKQISVNEIYLLIKYIKSVLWRVAKLLCYIEEARCLKVKWTSQNKNIPNSPTLAECKFVSIKGLWTYENTRPCTDWWQYVIYLKCLDRFQEWIPHIKTTKQGHINMCPERVILQSNWKTTFNNNYIN